MPFLSSASPTRRVQYCDGKTWVSEGGPGSSKNKAAESCDAIYAVDSTLLDGQYWVKTAEGVPKLDYCYMSMADGGVVPSVSFGTGADGSIHLDTAQTYNIEDIFSGYNWKTGKVRSRSCVFRRMERGAKLILV